MQTKTKKVLPAIIEINAWLRLVAFDGVRIETYQWYRDQVILDNVMGKNRLPFMKREVEEMYYWQTKESEVFYIEIFENEKWITIGDTAFSQHDLPIVIAQERFRARGIGRMIIQKFIDIARENGYEYLEVEEVFSYNEASHRMFTQLGFVKKNKQRNGFSYYLDLS